MKRKTVFSFFLILFSSLFLVPLVYSVECFELKYDDGTAEAGTSVLSGQQFGVKFTLPQNLETARLVMARFYIYEPDYVCKAHVYDLDGNDLVPSFLVDPVFVPGWRDVGLNVWVSGDFFIALEILYDNHPLIGEDLSTVQGPSYWRMDSSYSWQPYPDGNHMIRAVVCIPPPIGGELIPKTVPTLGSLLIVGILTITATIGIAYRKRKTF